ncbi:MAG TPA: nucleotidyltransferase family protein [Micromonosporaceae bacterium]
MGHALAAGLVLAAGGGRRYGGPKALVRLGDRLLVERAVRVVRDAGCAPLVVVLGAAADRVRAEADLAGVTVVDNPDWATGMGSSLVVGLRALGDTDAAAAVVQLVDIPGVTSAAVARFVGLAAPDALARASYRGRPGHPVLLGREHWSGVACRAVGDQGAREYLAAHADEVITVPCDDVADGADLDVPPQ